MPGTQASSASARLESKLTRTNNAIVIQGRRVIGFSPAG
jgi:hypothetical protein